MGSIYDRTSNIYRSNFKQVRLTNTGYFGLENEEAKIVTVFNMQPGAGNDQIDVAKVDGSNIEVDSAPAWPWEKWMGTHNVAAHGASGTAYVTGVAFTLEEGMSFQVRGIGNANQIAVKKSSHLNSDLNVKYVIEK